MKKIISLTPPWEAVFQLSSVDPGLNHAQSSQFAEELMNASWITLRFCTTATVLGIIDGLCNGYVVHLVGDKNRLFSGYSLDELLFQKFYEKLDFI